MKDPHYEIDDLDELERDLIPVRIYAVVWLMFISSGICWAAGYDTLALITAAGSIGFLDWMKESL